MRIAVAWFVVLAAVTLAFPSPTDAHSQFASSSPAPNGILASPPTRVTITFTEAVAAEPPGSPSVRVTNSSGSQVDAGLATVSTQEPREVSLALNTIGPGIYTVTWSVKSAVDGHSSRGSFSFGVQNPDGSLPGILPSSGANSPAQTVSPVEVAARFFAFLGTTIAFGAAILTVLAWAPGARDATAVNTDQYNLGLRILDHWGRVGALLLALGAALWWTTVGISVSGTLFNASLVARIVAALVLLSIFSLASKTVGSEVPGQVPKVAWAAVVAGGFAIVGGSVGTHAAADSGLLGVALDGVHVACLSAWFGGLLALVRLRPMFQGVENVALGRHVYGRFSRLAFYAVGGVLLAGTGMGLLLVGTLDRLLGSSYGLVLLAKVSLVIPMIALGAWNRYRLLPSAAGSGDAPAKAIRRLTANIRREVAFGAVVLAAAALLTALVPPAIVAGTGHFELETIKDGVRFEFFVEPYPRTPGAYTYSILVLNATSGADYSEARNATMTFTLVGSTLAPQSFPMDGPHGNHFFSYSPVMSQAGTWKVDVLLQRASGFDIRVTFHIVAEAASGP